MVLIRMRLDSVDVLACMNLFRYSYLLYEKMGWMVYNDILSCTGLTLVGWGNLLYHFPEVELRTGAAIS